MTTTTEAPKSLHGTQTEKNLCDAYLNETQAYARYVYYAQAAVKQMYYPVQIAFQDSAMNELHHAKVYLGHLQGGQVTVSLPVDAERTPDTVENLKIAIYEEETEGVEAYTAYAKVAKDEGFDLISQNFLSIAAVEREHAARFKKYLEQIQNNTVWKRDTPITWKCLVCGYLHVGLTPPMPKCPACNHPYQHFIGMDMLMY